MQAAASWEQEAAADSISTHALPAKVIIYSWAGEGFTIPVNLTQGRLSHYQDPRHLGPWYGSAHVSNRHSLRTSSVPNSSVNKELVVQA